MRDTAVITCALSGAVSNKEQCPGIPYTPEEYAKEPRRTRDAGASMVHIQDAGRSPDRGGGALPGHHQGHPGGDPDIIVNLSTGWVGLPIAERVDHITELRPEIGALNMGSMNHAKYSSKRKGFVFSFVFENSFDDMVFLLRRMGEAGVKPDYACLRRGPRRVRRAADRSGRRLSSGPVPLVRGVLGGISATPRKLAHMASVGPSGSTWGNHRHQPGAVDKGRGGRRPRRQLRVGFEDNFYPPSGEMASSNGELVEADAHLARLHGREVAEPASARRLLSVPGEPDRSPALGA